MDAALRRVGVLDLPHRAEDVAVPHHGQGPSHGRAGFDGAETVKNHIGFVRRAIVGAAERLGAVLDQDQVMLSGESNERCRIEAAAEKVRHHEHAGVGRDRKVQSVDPWGEIGYFEIDWHGHQTVAAYNGDHVRDRDGGYEYLTSGWQLERPQHQIERRPRRLTVESTAAAGLGIPSLVNFCPPRHQTSGDPIDQIRPANIESFAHPHFGLRMITGGRLLRRLRFSFPEILEVVAEDQKAAPKLRNRRMRQIASSCARSTRKSLPTTSKSDVSP